MSVLPIDDLIHEGDHSGLIFLELASSDVVYNNLTSPAVPVSIQDNDCHPLTSPAHGALISCSQTYDQTCKIRCDLGFDDRLTAGTREARVRVGEEDEGGSITTHQPDPP